MLDVELNENALLLQFPSKAVTNHFFTSRFSHKGTTLRIRKVLDQLNFSPRITCESHFVNSNDLLVLIQCYCFLSAPECWCDISKIGSPVMNTL